MIVAKQNYLPIISTEKNSLKTKINGQFFAVRFMSPINSNLQITLTLKCHVFLLLSHKDLIFYQLCAPKSIQKKNRPTLMYCTVTWQKFLKTLIKYYLTYCTVGQQVCYRWCLKYRTKERCNTNIPSLGVEYNFQLLQCQQPPLPLCSRVNSWKLFLLGKSWKHWEHLPTSSHTFYLKQQRIISQDTTNLLALLH